MKYPVPSDDGTGLLPAVLAGLTSHVQISLQKHRGEEFALLRPPATRQSPRGKPLSLRANKIPPPSRWRNMIKI